MVLRAGNGVAINYPVAPSLDNSRERKRLLVLCLGSFLEGSFEFNTKKLLVLVGITP